MADEKRFLWAKLPRCPVLWPVQAVEDSSLKVKVYCYSDHAELVINKTSTEPFPGPFEDYKDKGIAQLSNQVAKGHQGVPIIIPEGAKTGMKFISDCAVRKEVGINMESPYLFATTGENIFRVYDALSYNCRKADLQYPERITCTNLRKYMATITQVLDLKPHQLEWVLKHMGHTLDVHKIYYRATSDVIERTQIAKILLLQDSGRLPEFSNKSLEDIQLTDLAEPDETGEMAAQDGIETDDLDELLEESENMAQVEDEFTNDKIPSRRKNRQKNSSKTRQRWSPDEEEEIRKIFHK